MRLEWIWGLKAYFRGELEIGESAFSIGSCEAPRRGIGLVAIERIESAVHVVRVEQCVGGDLYGAEAVLVDAGARAVRALEPVANRSVLRGAHLVASLFRITYLHPERFSYKYIDQWKIINIYRLIHWYILINYINIKKWKDNKYCYPCIICIKNNV